MRRIALFLLLPAALLAQPVRIVVDASAKVAPYRHITSYFGYDEPNYTYMPNGKKLIGELAALSPVPVQIRAHHLLVTGDGTPALKWGSTNAYTEDAAGKPVYDWTIVDRIFDTYIQAGAKPFVEIGFMPEALSTTPQPYIVNWPANTGKGWSYPPKDYDKWAELVRQWVLHCVARYGREEVAQWSWELWNEPDISYWRGTPEEYNKLYDYTARAVKSALPAAKVGGPGTTGASAPKAAQYLRQFLEHCAKNKTPLDLITYHAKGQPRVVNGHVQMGLRKNIADVQQGLEVIKDFPQYKSLPIVLTESDPEGCAACSARTYPQNLYRNGLMYPSYTAAALNSLFALTDRYQANLAGMLTWAFEFEGQPYFDGFRTLATNGVDKPVLNLFRMAGMFSGDRVKVESTGAVSLDQLLAAGVREQPDINALATSGDREMTVLVWNYHDDDLPAASSPVHLEIRGVKTLGPVLLQHYRIDNTHSNSYTVWQEMGKPQQPTPDQYAKLEAAGHLQLLASPSWHKAKSGTLPLDFDLPRHAVSLLRLTW
jgi:xylan 1,4-beta-xylosidase